MVGENITRPQGDISNQEVNVEEVNWFLNLWTWADGDLWRCYLENIIRLIIGLVGIILSQIHLHVHTHIQNTLIEEYFLSFKKNYCSKSATVVIAHEQKDCLH